ncbi:MAG: pilus assembly protein TadG-related protein [Gaiellaceae bacterium]
MKLRRDEAGQVTVMAALFMIVVIGMTAFVVDVGSWFRAQRATQSTVDAAALAGAQALPQDPAKAAALAIAYGNDNGGGVAGANITFSSTYEPNDTITVKTTRPTEGFFSRIFGIFSVTVGAHATAMAGVPSEAQYVAPIAVNIKHPLLSGPGCPCFGPANQTTLSLGKTGAPGAFDLINLNYGQTSGTVGTSTMASWIQDGYDKFLPLGGYYSDPGAKYNGSQVNDALDARVGTDLLFPVYDTLTGQGSNASYHVIAWVGFHLLPDPQLQGNSGSLTGYFTRVIWKGVVPTPNASPAPDLGDYSIALVD